MQCCANCTPLRHGALACTLPAAVKGSLWTLPYGVKQLTKSRDHSHLSILQNNQKKHLLIFWVCVYRYVFVCEQVDACGNQDNLRCPLNNDLGTIYFVFETGSLIDLGLTK